MGILNITPDSFAQRGPLEPAAAVDTALHMAAEAVYTDVTAEVVAELRTSIAAACAAGVAVERIIADPGIGFAKQPSHSYGVLAHIADIAATLDRPLLVGASRKSFLREAVGG